MASVTCIMVYLPRGTDDMKAEGLNVYDSLEEAIADLRQHWNEEEEGPQHFLLNGDDGMPLATMFRPAGGDNELCVTCYANGRSETHRCHYLTGPDGYYAGTVIEEVGVSV